MGVNNNIDKRIKRILADIIDVAYNDESGYMREKYKDFNLRIENYNLSSKHGTYNPREHSIVVNNMYRGTGSVIKTCLHELAHHIDFTQNGRTGHQKPFYLAYRRLIYASLDMSLTKKSDFDTVDSSDSNKVWKMVEEYTPRKVYYVPPEERIIKVRNCYAKKDELKSRGFRWNSIEQVWERKSEDEEADINLMKELELSDYTITQASLRVEAITYLVASGKTYDVKDILKEKGFFYKKEEKSWVKKIPSDQFDGEYASLTKDERLKGVRFALLSNR